MAEHRIFNEPKLVIASHNPGKVREIGILLEAFDVEVVSAATLGLGEPDETGSTFVANAELKARAATEASGLPALADDSGLWVDPLGGHPGIYSARWAGPEKDFGLAMNLVREALEEQEDGLSLREPTARFICALSLAWPDGHIETFEGKVHGTLTFPPRGENGFGYDPIFVPTDYEITFGEMDPDAKHAMSHRADAFTQLVAACFQK